MDGHKAPMKARFPRPTASCPFYSKPPRDTKLLPVVQLQSGVILLMGDPAEAAHTIAPYHPQLICSGG